MRPPPPCFLLRWGAGAIIQQTFFSLPSLPPHRPRCDRRYGRYGGIDFLYRKGYFLQTPPLPFTPDKSAFCRDYLWYTTGRILTELTFLSEPFCLELLFVLAISDAGRHICLHDGLCRPFLHSSSCVLSGRFAVPTLFGGAVDYSLLTCPFPGGLVLDDVIMLFTLFFFCSPETSLTSFLTFSGFALYGSSPFLDLRSLFPLSNLFFSFRGSSIGFCDFFLCWLTADELAYSFSPSGSWTLVAFDCR